MPIIVFAFIRFCVFRFITCVTGLLVACDGIDWYFKIRKFGKSSSEKYRSGGKWNA